MADLIITVTINDTDQKCMKNDLLDLNQWVQEAVTGKKNNCWKRLQREWTQKFIDDESFTDPIPSNRTDFVNLVLSQPTYKDRVTRDAAREI